MSGLPTDKDKMMTSRSVKFTEWLIIHLLSHVNSDIWTITIHICRKYCLRKTKLNSWVRKRIFCAIINFKTCFGMSLVSYSLNPARFHQLLGSYSSKRDVLGHKPSPINGLPNQHRSFFLIEPVFPNNNTFKQTNI